GVYACGATSLCACCGKLEREVRKLLGRGGIALCDECVALCCDILDAELGGSWRSPAPRLAPPRAWRCGGSDSGTRGDRRRGRRAGPWNLEVPPGRLTPGVPRLEAGLLGGGTRTA